MTDGFARLADCLADRYRLERILGASGMATVYLARDIKHDRSVAVKVLKPELAEWLGVERFHAEIKTTARLRHPHILPLFDSGEDDGALYYVMPVVDSLSLRQRLERDGTLPLEDALRIASEVADALAHAHAHEIVHLDIKPENILIEDGRALVVDFGIARVMREIGDPRMSQSGHALGTPLFMSPDQAAIEAFVDGRSDLYSLACVLFEMLTGQPPFTGATAEAILVQRFTKAAPRVTELRDDVPASIDATIRRALSRAPDDRHASVTLFAAQLREAPALAIAADEQSIAVLPFVNMSADPENEYFSDGIAEDIINALAHVAGLRVAARTSSKTDPCRSENRRAVIVASGTSGLVPTFTSNVAAWRRKLVLSPDAALYSPR